MSFVALTSGEIASGESVKATTQTKIKNNFDNHETRLQTLESANTGDPPITFRIGGYYTSGTGILKTTTNLALTLTGIRLLIDTAGSSGTTQIDIKRSRSGGAYTSVFTTLPSVAFGAGNDALSSNGVLDGTMTGFIAGDILRLDITSNQVSGKGFLVRIDFQRA